MGGNKKYCNQAHQQMGMGKVGTTQKQEEIIKQFQIQDCWKVLQKEHIMCHSTYVKFKIW